MRSSPPTAPSDGPSCPSSKLRARISHGLIRRLPLGSPGSPLEPIGSPFELQLESQSGMTLIEVLIASVLAAFIAIGTFTAFDAAGRSSADQRAHAQGTLLSQQDQERMRSFTTTTLEQMGTVTTTRAENGLCVEKSGSSYIYYNQGKNTLFCEKVTGFAGATYKGVVFTVTSSASFVSAEKGSEQASLACEKSGGSANYLQTKSSVTWTALGKRTPVSQVGVLTIPSSYVLLVKVRNQNNEPVEGATVAVTSGPSTTTPASGCVTFGALASETVEITAAKGSWVSYEGKTPATKSGVKLSSSSLTEIELHLAEPGSIVGEFEINGVSAGIEGVSFYALQTEFGIAPPDWVASSATPEHKLTLSSLFPAAKSGKPSEYTVFAGDCEANNPATVTASGEKLVDKSAPVMPGGSSSVKVEVPAINVTVYEGTKSTPKGTLNSAEYAYVENEECKTGTAQNVTGTVTYQHKVALAAGGHLESKYKYQPYAKELVLCVTTKIGTEYMRNTFKVANTKKAGTGEYKFYLQEVKNTEDSGVEKTTIAGKLKCP